MTDDRDEEPRGFKVVDRRPFDADGEERPDFVAVDAVEAEAPAREGAPASAGVQPGRPASPGTLDFASLIKSLLAAGLFQAGVLAEEGEDPPPPDPVGARQTLDTLLLLREKTQGNLTADEERLFPDAIGELALSLGLRLLAPAALRALDEGEGGSLDVARARAEIDGLGALVEAVRGAAREDAVRVLESALTDLRMRYVSAAGA